MGEHDKEYWEAFYAKSGLTREPSLFARYCAANLVTPGHRLVEAGCGNGRDAVALANAGASVTAIDQCEQTIARLKEEHAGVARLRFEADDFVRHPYGADEPMDAFYSRFTLHAISAAEESVLLGAVIKGLRAGGLILMEFRGRKNELNGLGRPATNEPFVFEYEGHRRRFIDTEALALRLVGAGVDILSCEERPSFSPFQGKDETFARIIGRMR